MSPVLQVLRVSVAEGRVTGPTPLRVSLSQTVAELRQALGLPDSGRLCLARFCGELRPLINPERSLKLEGFHRNSRVSPSSRQWSEMVASTSFTDIFVSYLVHIG